MDVCEIVVSQYSVLMCVNFLFVDQQNQNQGSLSRTICTIPGQHAQLQFQSKCITSIQHVQPIHSKYTIPVQHAQLQAKCTILDQDKLSHSICTISDQDAPIQSKCNTSCQDKLIQYISGQQKHIHPLLYSSTAPLQLHHTNQVTPHRTQCTSQLQQQQPKSKAEKEKGGHIRNSKGILRMHSNTWKQSDMVGVNHLCMIQGNEESTSSFFL